MLNPLVKELVLIGGGHSHAIALRMFGMNPLTGVRLTLITEASDTAYSGMVPGHVAGFYSREECHIDLHPLVQFAGGQLYLDQVVGLDLDTQRVLCANRPPVAFDLLSIDIGSTPKLPEFLAGSDAVIPAKPVRRFLEQWNHMIEHIRQTPESPVSLGIVGGGAGGVELALTMQHQLQQIFNAANQPSHHLTLHLFQREAELMPKHSRWVRDRFRQLLHQRGIQLHLQESVEDVKHHQIRCKSGLTVNCDDVIWVTQASAPAWLGNAGLTVNEEGFVLVDDYLRSLSHPHIFAAGDIATMVNHPRPKAGVFAVRQGKPLFNNLRRTLMGQPLQVFRPQKQYLSLIGTGDGSAIATWGPFGWEASWLWTWKDRIDRAFMRQFSELPTMPSSPSGTAVIPVETPALPAMFCAGCGSKVGSPVLTQVLQRIQRDIQGSYCLPSSSLADADILIGLDAPDDAAVIQVPAGNAIVQTIDYFPALVNDPFIFAQISTNHALSDLFAMGASPHSALAIATLPHAGAAILEETLYQLLSGALKVLEETGAVLIGGHTLEGEQLGFGLACNGLATPDRLLRKGGMHPGQALLLTKAIGTGTLFAAQMQLKAKGRWIDGAIASMLLSNYPAAKCLLEYQASACTDVTGFGLAGHLLEMIRASQVSVKLDLEAIPLLDGALETAERGIVSSLYSQNLQATQWITASSEVHRHPKFSLLFDPQTSGGLLASVPEVHLDRCLTDLKNLGYGHSTVIGHVLPPTGSSQLITILS